jgi:hypothetical protein
MTTYKEAFDGTGGTFGPIVTLLDTDLWGVSRDPYTGAAQDAGLSWAVLKENIQDLMNSTLVGGSNISITYNDPANTITIAFTGTVPASTDDLPEGATNLYFTNERAQDAVGAMVDATIVYVDATPLLTRAALTGAITAAQGSNATVLGSFTKAELSAAVSDGDPLYVGDVLGITAVGSPITFSSGTLDFDETVALGNNARVAVSKNSLGTVGTRRRINFIEGSNVTLTIADDSGNEEVDVTIAASGGGGGGLGDPGANGVVVRTALDTTVARTITAGTGIGVTNGDGVSGNPTIAITDAELLAVAGLSSAANKLIMFTGAGTADLIDFEEGTFTPTITCDTPGTLSVTYSHQVGRYQRMKARCLGSIHVRASSITLGTATGALRIDGNPFTSANPTNMGGYVGATPRVDYLTFSGILAFTTILNGTYSVLRQCTSGADTTAAQIGSVGSTNFAVQTTALFEIA